MKPTATQDRIEIEGRLAKVETLITEIKDNHLVHLDAKMDKLQWLIITTLLGVVVDLALRLLPHA